MKVTEVPSAPLYPELPAEEQIPAEPAQTFRLQKIGELEAFLRSEVEKCRRLSKKYRRAVNALDGTCAVLGAACVATGAVGAGLLASGIGFAPGVVLEAITGLAGLLEVAGVTVSRRCSTKAAKHEAICVLASSKLNSVQSKALEDCNISDEEYKLVLDEVEKYRVMKEELRRKRAAAVGSVIDEATKNELIRRGREQACTSFIKKLTASESL